MTSIVTNTEEKLDNWQFAIPVAEVPVNQAKMLRIAGKQIAFFNTGNGVKACDNRCPHEGFPLSEGSLSQQCTLTCNWHNWKFDLETGENLYGGDRLRTYPVQIRAGDIWVDITEPPYQQRYEQICNSLHDAFDDYSYDRIAREIARLIKLGADPLDVLRLSIEWSWQNLEFGWTHAYAGMADWLQLYNEHQADEESQLVCLVESVAHVAYDVLREGNYHYTEQFADFDEEKFLNDIECENEAGAIAAIRGGIQAGLGFDDFEPALCRAALAHYNDFGHSIIYVTKAGYLIDKLGTSVMAPLLLSLVRGIIFASREDMIPEFRAYHDYLKQWGQHKNRIAETALWRKKSINKSMQAVIDCSGDHPTSIYKSLLLANAVNLLNFDMAQQDRAHISVSGNVGWLDFTHGLTFANAIHQQCQKFPELWPQALLQLACFNGRNASFTTNDSDPPSVVDIDPVNCLEEIVERILDHGQGEHIVSVHLLKTALSVRAEIASLELAETQMLVAALKRFFESPIKRRQARRTAYQSMQFVAKE